MGDFFFFLKRDKRGTLNQKQFDRIMISYFVDWRGD